MKLPSLDPTTAFVTVVATPLLYLVLKRIVIALKHLARYIIDWLMFALSRTVIHSMSARISLRQYCRNQLASHQTRFLQVPGSGDVTLETDRIFVPLTLEMRGVRDRTFSHRDILEAGHRLRVVGDPGSGKSSLVKRILRDSCRQALAAPGKSRLPIMIELKSFVPPGGPMTSEELGSWAYNEVRRSVIVTRVYEMGTCFDNYVASTGILVLLDGLDEVASNTYLRTAEALQSLSRRLQAEGPNNAIILTTRTQFHQQVRDQFVNDLPPTLTVRSFKPSEIYEFLTRWPFESNNNEIVARIYGDLTDKPTLREMCSNPLVLAMYVANDQTGDQTDLPDTRTAFYSKITEELLVARRARQLGSTARTSLREQRESILGRLAFEHLTDPKQAPNSLRWDQALRVVAELLHLEDSDDAEEYLRVLANETGLIREEQQRRIVSVHTPDLL
jgi:predicted NACHT family NTPase